MPSNSFKSFTLLNSNIASVIVIAILTFAVWITSELYRTKYDSLSRADEERIEAHMEDYIDKQLAAVVTELERIRIRLETLSKQQMDLLLELRGK